MASFPVFICDGQDGMVVVECPVLPGCVSQGTSRNDALANIREAIALCVASGDQPRADVVDVEMVYVDTR